MFRSAWQQAGIILTLQAGTTCFLAQRGYPTFPWWQFYFLMKPKHSKGRTSVPAYARGGSHGWRVFPVWGVFFKTAGTFTVCKMLDLKTGSYMYLPTSYLRVMLTQSWYL